MTTNTNWREAPIFGFDLETTSPKPTECRIVTACVVDERGPQNWILNPEIEIPAGAAAVHGITTERAQAEGMDYAEGLAQISHAIHSRWAEGRNVAIYNAPFDLTVLEHECRRVFGQGFPIVGMVLDPFVIDRAIDKFRKGKRTLGVTCEHYGLKLENAHEAEADAVAAARLAWKLSKSSAFDNVDDIMAWQTEAHRGKQADFANYLRKNGKDASDVDGNWPVRL